MATEIDILNSDINNEQNVLNSTNTLIQNDTPLSISKSREKRMTKLLLVGIILPFSVFNNIQSSEIPAWYNKETKEPVNFPLYIRNIRLVGQIAGTIATIALFLKSVHIGSSFQILKWRLHRKHRVVIMIIGALIQCICSIFILIYYYKNIPNYADEYKTSEVGYFTIQSIILSLLTIILLSKDANKRNRIFRQSGLKPKNRLSYMQRQLIVLEITDIFYTLIGGLLFSKLENWSFNDSVYFTVTTLMTCGTGDFTPNSLIGKLTMMVYAIPGILLTTYTVYSIYSVISEILYAKVYKDFSQFINVSNDMYFQNYVKNDKSTSSQLTGLNDSSNGDLHTSSSLNNDKHDKKKEEEVKKSPIITHRNEASLSTQQNNKDISSSPSYNINVSDQQRRPRNPRNNTQRYFESRRSILFNDSNSAVLQTLRFDTVGNDYEDSSSSDDSSYSEDGNDRELEHLLSKKNKHGKNNSSISNHSSISNYNSIQTNSSIIMNNKYCRNRHLSYQIEDNPYLKYSDKIEGMDERGKRTKALMLTRRNTLNMGQSNVQGVKLISSNQEIDTDKVLKQTRDLNQRQLKLSFTLLFLIILFFSLLYSCIENWSFFEAIYFCFVNLFTIGYGDFVPQTVYGKSIFMYFMYSAVSATTWVGTVLLQLATGKWEIYIEKTDLEDELYGNDVDKKKEQENSHEEKEEENLN